MGKILAVLRIIILALMLVVFMVILVPSHFIFNFSVETRFKIRESFCAVAFWVLGVELNFEGKPVKAKGPAIVVCNHRSLLDPFINARYVDAYFLGKAEVSKYPFFGYGANLTGAIFVERENKSSRAATRKAMAEVLGQGYNVLLYPEGTTNGEDTTKRFYKGSFEVASELNVPVIPVVLEYQNRDHYWTSGGLMAKCVEQLSGWKMHLYMWVGDPIPAKAPMDMLDDAQGQIDARITMIQKQWGNL